jgi:UDP-N-acetylglucosamine--N-acetylmuramyl-(pentapeptide) pyrophosphoryl-undecaprenol N-acetylglucosamine transferase
MLPSDQVSADRLADLLAGLLADGERLAAIGRAARALARPRAAADIADRVERIEQIAAGRAA